MVHQVTDTRRPYSHANGVGWVAVPRQAEPSGVANSHNAPLSELALLHVRRRKPGWTRRSATPGAQGSLRLRRFVT